MCAQPHGNFASISAFSLMVYELELRFGWKLIKLK